MAQRVQQMPSVGVGRTGHMGPGTGVLGPIKEHLVLDDNYLLILLNYFLLYLIPNEFTFPMHTLAIGYDLASSESVHLAKGGVWDGVLLITLNYFLLYLMTKRIHFPMHTLAIAFDLAPAESLHPTVGLGVQCRMGNGTGCGTVRDGVQKPFTRCIIIAPL